MKPLSVEAWTAHVPDGDTDVVSEDLVELYFAERRQQELGVVEQRWSLICPAKLADAEWSNVWYLDDNDVEIPGLRDIVKRAQEWTDRVLVEKDPGNLVFFGDLGVGKSWIALCCARQLHFAGKHVLFTPVAELLEYLRPRDHQVDVSVYTKPDVLILDDLGAEKPSDWTRDRLYLIVNRRWLECRPTIVTTNLKLKGDEGLEGVIGARILDRLRDGATALSIGGESRRKPRKKAA